MDASETAPTTRKSSGRGGAWRLWRRTSSQTAASTATTDRLSNEESELPSYPVPTVAAQVGCGVWPFARRSLVHETNVSTMGPSTMAASNAVHVPLETGRSDPKSAPVMIESSEVWADDPSHTEVSHYVHIREVHPNETARNADAIAAVDVDAKTAVIEDVLESASSANVAVVGPSITDTVGEALSLTSRVIRDCEVVDALANETHDVLNNDAVTPEDLAPRNDTGLDSSTDSATRSDTAERDVVPSDQSSMEKDKSAAIVAVDVTNNTLELALDRAEDVVSPNPSVHEENDATNTTANLATEEATSPSSDTVNQVDTTDTNDNTLSSRQVRAPSSDQVESEELHVCLELKVSNVPVGIVPADSVADEVEIDQASVESNATGLVDHAVPPPLESLDVPSLPMAEVDPVEGNDADAPNEADEDAPSSDTILDQDQAKAVSAIYVPDDKALELTPNETDPIPLTNSLIENVYLDPDDDVGATDNLQQDESESDESDGVGAKGADGDSTLDVGAVNRAKNCLENSFALDRANDDVDEEEDDEDGDEDVDDDIVNVRVADRGMDQSCHTHAEVEGNWHVDVESDLDDSSVLTEDDESEAFSKADGDLSESSVDDYSDEEEDEEDNGASEGGFESMGDEQDADCEADVNRGLSFGDASFVMRSDPSETGAIHDEQNHGPSTIVTPTTKSLLANDTSLDVAEPETGDDEKKGRMLTRRGVQRQATGDSLQLLQVSASGGAEATAAAGETKRRGGRRKQTLGDTATEEVETTTDNTGDVENKVPMLTRRGVQRQPTGDSLHLLQASANAPTPVESKRRGGRRKSTTNPSPENPSEIETEGAGNDDEKKGRMLTRRGVQRQATGDSLQLLQVSASGGKEATPSPVESKRRGGRRKSSSDVDVPGGEQGNEPSAEGGDSEQKGPILTRRGVQRQPTGDSLQLLQKSVSGSAPTPVESKRRGGRRKSTDSDMPNAEQGDTEARTDNAFEEANKGPMLTRRGVQRQPTGDSLQELQASVSRPVAQNDSKRRGGRRKGATASDTDVPVIGLSQETATKANGDDDEMKGPMLTRRGLHRQPTGDSVTFGMLVGGTSASAAVPVESQRRGGRRKTSPASGADDAAMENENEATVDDAKKGPMLTRRGVQRQSTGDSLQELQTSASGARSAPVEAKRRGGRRTATPDGDAAVIEPETEADTHGGDDEKKGTMLTRRGLQRQATGDSDTLGLLQASVGAAAKTPPVVIEAPRRGGRKKAAPVSDTDETTGVESNKTATEGGDEDEKKGPLLTRRGIQRQATGDSVSFGELVTAAGPIANQPAPEPHRRGGRRKANNSDQNDASLETQNEPSADNNDDGPKKGPLLTRRGIQRQSTGDSDTLGLLQASANSRVDAAPAVVESKRRGGRRAVPVAKNSNDTAVEIDNDATGQGTDDGQKAPLLTRRGVQRQSTGDSATFGLLIGVASGSTDATAGEPTRRSGRHKTTTISDCGGAPVEKEHESTTQDDEKKAPILTRRGVQRQSTGDSDTLGLLLAGTTDGAEQSRSAPIESARRGGRRKSAAVSDDAAANENTVDEAAVDEKGPMLNRKGLKRQPTGDADSWDAISRGPCTVSPAESPVCPSPCDEDESSNSDITSPCLTDEADMSGFDTSGEDAGVQAETLTDIDVSDNDEVVDGSDVASEAFIRLCKQNEATMGILADDTVGPLADVVVETSVEVSPVDSDMVAETVVLGEEDGTEEGEATSIDDPGEEQPPLVSNDTTDATDIPNVLAEKQSALHSAGFVPEIELDTQAILPTADSDGDEH